MYHSKLDEAKDVLNIGQSVLLTGEKGSGKTTIAMNLAEELGLEFYSESMTRQTTLSMLLGYRNVHGDYVATKLRKAAEFGGLMLLDELDAADANVVLCLNPIENGYLSFPDTNIKLHKDFRLMATANPPDQHSQYTGRVKLDAATLDRFDIIEVERDEDLERSLVDEDTFQRMKVLRAVLRDHNSSIVVSMRDSMRFQSRKVLNRTEGYIERLTDHNQAVLEVYNRMVDELPKYQDQKDCVTFEDLTNLIKTQSKE